MDMFIEIKLTINTLTQNIYFLYKRNVYTPNETWTYVLLRLSAIRVQASIDTQ